MPAPTSLAPARRPLHLQVLDASRTAAIAGPARGHRIDAACGVASRQSLLARLRSIGEIAPAAPLSFLAVRVEGMDDRSLLHDEVARDRVRTVAQLTQKLTRPTDFVGRLGPTTVGVILQGTGSCTASTIASRLSHQLRLLAPCRPPLSVSVSAASGTGENATTLPVAAMDGFEDCC